MFSGINLTTAQIEFNVAITLAATLDGIASDTSSNLYVIDTSGKIFKIKISSQNYSLYVSSGCLLILRIVYMMK